LSGAPAPAKVTVRVPARLHLGFLDLNGGLGRRFGSIGLAISGRRTSITIGAAAQMRVTGPEHERVRGHIERMRHALDLRGGYDATIDEVVPAHVGLGSGTQLALAVAAGLRRLHGLPLDVRNDAIRLGRGARSGVGIGLFEQGGLVVDGGRGSAQTPAPIVSRLPFPEQWRILVVLDPHRQGVHGPDERELFGKLAPCPDAEAAHLCRLVLMQALPALADYDIAAFGSAIKELQARLGDYFAPIQGGSRFSSPDVAAALDLLESEGALGIGQSSWGPTGFAFVPSAEAADRLLARTRGDPRFRDLDICACTGLNRGAEITAHAAADEPERQRWKTTRASGGTP
jgi:beta-ribofuranosylaminobenzene 5'-phosphate synthase